MSGMLIPPGPVRVLVAMKPVDFRKGMNGLAALVQEQLKADPFSGTIYGFRSTRADRVKLVFWDGTGLCLLWRIVPSVFVYRDAGDQAFGGSRSRGSTTRWRW
jgi:transposase